MFDFLGRGRKKPVEKTRLASSDRTPVAALELPSPFTLSTRNFQDFQENDVTVKLWLPEPAQRRLAELSDHWGLSLSKLLRYQFFKYLYGEYQFEAMRARSAGLFWNPRIMAKAVRHRSGPNTTPELGKNAEDVKVWLPSRMKADLQDLADRSEKPLSQFMRELLVSLLFGNLPLAEALQAEAEK